MRRLMLAVTLVVGLMLPAVAGADSKALARFGPGTVNEAWAAYDAIVHYGQPCTSTTTVSWWSFGWSAGNMHDTIDLYNVVPYRGPCYLFFNYDSPDLDSWRSYCWNMTDGVLTLQGRALVPFPAYCDTNAPDGSGP